MLLDMPRVSSQCVCMLLACFCQCVHVCVCLAADSMNVMAAVCLGFALANVALSHLGLRFRKSYDGGLGPLVPGISWQWVAPQLPRMSGLRTSKCRDGAVNELATHRKWKKRKKRLN